MTKRTPVKKSSPRRAKPAVAASTTAASASALINARIRELADWRGTLLARLRDVILRANPGIVEEWKWGVPVWSHGGGIICTGETYKKAVKLTFAKGAAVDDPAGLFNSSLEGNTRRAIDFYEGEDVNDKDLKALVRAAAALGASRRSEKTAPPVRQAGRAQRH